MKAFKGKQSIKDKYLKRLQKHYEADEIIHGVYWQDGKGCAVGCTVEQSTNAHEAMEKELDIPQELAYLEDVIFEELTNGIAKEFPLRFLKAINVGADLTKVIAQVVIWQFEDEVYGLKNIPEIQDDKEVYGFCEEVVALYRRDLNGDKASEEEYYELYKKINTGAGVRAWAWAGAGVRVRAGVRAWAWAWAGAGAGVRVRAWAWASYNKRINVTADKLISLLEETN